MSKILITGGAGFIGCHLAQKLIQRGNTLILVDNFNDYYEPKLKKDRVKNLLRGKKYKLYQVDIRERVKMENIFQKERPDEVVHLAAMAGVRYSLEKPFLYTEVNVMGTLNLLEVSCKYKVKNFIFASSSSVYGANKKIPFSENDFVDNPVSPYAATKKAGELLAHVYSQTWGLPVSGLRFFTVYGPWGRPDMAYFKFTRNILTGKVIDVYNQGKMFRDFTYIDDIIEGILKIMEKKRSYEIFNIGADRPEKLLKFIEVIEKNLGVKAKKRMLPMQKGDVPYTAADVRKLKKLGWRPKVKIEEGIKKFVQWYKWYYKV